MNPRICPICNKEIPKYKAKYVGHRKTFKGSNKKYHPWCSNKARLLYSRSYAYHRDEIKRVLDQ